MRCRNCGELTHATQLCGEYGPWFPEEGKSKNDYCELAAKIDALIAADIIAEHQANHAHEQLDGD